ncbi:hypothetical protein HJC23_006519 [Cyclotella cryptica]|uniref:Uncharacterized protein n=1 Tax=Cyclotella cryptica TaxID=29204 RepID=A0ABD3NZC6_9STRA
MTDKHKLKGISKALRICITCVAVGDVAFTQDAQSTVADTRNCQEKTVELATEQLNWIERNLTESISISFAIREIVKACASTDEYTVFGIVRCKKSISDCEGASNAVRDLIQRYSKEELDVFLGDAQENIKF